MATSQIVTEERKEPHTRMDTMGASTDSLTASAVRGAASIRPDRYHSWPLDRSTDEVIAERMLMSALLNYRRAKTGHGTHEFKTHDQMSDIECGFYEDAVKKAYDAIWEGR